MRGRLSSRVAHVCVCVCVRVERAVSAGKAGSECESGGRRSKRQRAATRRQQPVPYLPLSSLPPSLSFLLRFRFFVLPSENGLSPLPPSPSPRSSFSSSPPAFSNLPCPFVVVPRCPSFAVVFLASHRSFSLFALFVCRLRLRVSSSTTCVLLSCCSPTAYARNRVRVFTSACVCVCVCFLFVIAMRDALCVCFFLVHGLLSRPLSVVSFGFF